MTILQAFVWRRSDFRESSRIVTLVTKEQGRLVVLAKGAHRKTSPTLGRLDFLNQVEVRLAGRGGMPILGRVRLVHEPRALRSPPRFLAATHVTALFDQALLDAEADPAMFELVLGAVRLIEKSPLETLEHVLLGIELRFLRHLGQLPDLDRCSACGAVSQVLWISRVQGGLACDQHRTANSREAPARALAWLQTLERTPGGRWPNLRRSPHNPAALTVVETWLAFALENRLRHRRLALRTLTELSTTAADQAD